MRVSRFALAMAVTACSAGRSPTVRGAPVAPLPPPPPPSVISFSETQPVTALASTGSRLYVGTPDGLVVWQVTKETFERWGAEYGLPNPKIRALATDDRDGVWVLSDAGLHLYNEDHFVGFENSPADLLRSRFLVAAQDGRTAWLGGLGVLRVRDGEFQRFLPGARVSAMARDADGQGVWVGTENEGAYRYAVDRFLQFGPDWGLTLKPIEAVALTRRGDPVMSGRGPRGEQIAYFDGKRFWGYRVAAAEVRVLGKVGKEVRIGVDRHIYAVVVAAAPDGARGDGPDAVPTEQGAPALSLFKRPGEVPYAPTVVHANRDGLYFGTATLGVLREEAEALTTRDVRGDRDRLALGCNAKACYFVGGGGRLYRLASGERSVKPQEPGPDRVLWMTNDPGGDLVALVAAEGQGRVRLCLFEEGRLVPRRVQEIAVPGGEPYVTFAGYSPGGDLWVRLSVRDAEGELANFGVAVLSASGGVTYHRAAPKKKKKTDDGSLPLPDEIRGAAFAADGTWLATLGGLVRIQGNQAVWLPREQAPVGDLCSDVAVGKDGAVWAASPDGVSRLSDGEWEVLSRDGPLARGASALQVDRDGAMLVGTPGGAFRWHGSSGERIEGTVGSGVLDLAIDRDGRLWVLTMDGYSVHPR